MTAVPRERDSARSEATAARLAAVQALYQIDMGSTVEQALAAATRDGPGARLDEEHRIDADPFVLMEIVRGVAERGETVDAMLSAALAPKWRLDRMERVLRAILRAGAFELLGRTTAPARAVLNEYVDLAHAYYDKAEAGLVNAVLDRLAHTLRPDEFATKEGHPDS